MPARVVSSSQACAMILLCGVLSAPQCHSATPDATVRDDGVPEQFFVGEVTWQKLYDPATKMNYFHNTETGAVQWEDPLARINFAGQRPQEPSPEKQPPPGNLANTQISIVLTIVITVVAGTAGRIYYLWTYFPEQLFPTKARKEKKKGWGRYKGPRGSNKMSQDGKGGRSANS